MTEAEADGAVAEYPKILSRRESSTISSTFNEYLQLAKNEDGTATLRILQYDVLGDAADYMRRMMTELSAHFPTKLMVRRWWAWNRKATLSAANFWILGEKS
jgi:hypothetical protein